MAVADISSLWTSSIYAPKSQVDNNGLTVAEVTKKNSNRDTLRYDLCCCQDNHFCLLQDNGVCPVIYILFKLDFGNYILHLIKFYITIFCIIILNILYILYRLGTFCKQFASINIRI